MKLIITLKKIHLEREFQSLDQCCPKKTQKVDLNTKPVCKIKLWKCIYIGIDFEEKWFWMKKWMKIVSLFFFKKKKLFLQNTWAFPFKTSLREIIIMSMPGAFNFHNKLDLRKFQKNPLTSFFYGAGILGKVFSLKSWFKSLFGNYKKIHLVVSFFPMHLKTFRIRSKVDSYIQNQFVSFFRCRVTGFQAF